MSVVENFDLEYLEDTDKIFWIKAEQDINYSVLICSIHSAWV